MDDILSEWIDLNADCNIRDRSILEWEKRNPLPDFRLPGNEGYSQNYRSDWHTRRIDALRQAQLHPVKSRRNELADAYTAAVKEFAALDAGNFAGLMVKVDAAIMVDSTNGIIARSEIWDIIDLSLSSEFKYQARAVSI